MASYLCNEIKNYLEIQVLEQNVNYDFRDAYPKSAEAYRYFIDGLYAIVAYNNESAIESLSKAVEIDSTFTFAAFYLAWAYNSAGLMEESYKWTLRAYELKHNLPSKYHPWINLWYACLITENRDDIIKYCGLLEKSELQSRFLWFDLGITFSDWLGEYNRCIKAYEKVEELNQEWGAGWKYYKYYNEYCWLLLMADRPREVNRIREIGLQTNPENEWLEVWQGSTYVMLKDSIAVKKSISELRSIVKKYKQPESYEEYVIGRMYYVAKDTIKAEEHYRIAYNLDPENRARIMNLAWVLIRSEINVEEGLELSRKALIKSPDDISILWSIGQALHKLGKHEEALVILKEVDEKCIGYVNELSDNIKEAEKAIPGQHNN